MMPKFGTSGLRGLVSELTEPLIKDYVRAFLRACNIEGPVYIGWDLRPSSPKIAEWALSACVESGCDVARFGALPTPALAFAAERDHAAAIMITGSHIPADRNGVKFYTPSGEISKQDEAAILANLAIKAAHSNGEGCEIEATNALSAYHDRYVKAFGAQALKGLRIGVYTHSTVGRDVLMRTIEACGADVIELGRSDEFIPVDTEAVDEDTRQQLARWSRDHKLDAIVSLDGDADRPMLCDETGKVVPGDVLGQITAQMLGATCVVTPISSNTGVSAIPGINTVIFTKIGSPYVIGGMQDAYAKGERKFVGYEANGGFLLGFEANGPSGKISPLATRDAFLPIMSTLVAAQAGKLSQRVSCEPQRFTSSNRLQNCDESRMKTLVAALQDDGSTRADFLRNLGETETRIDTTDGVRMICDSGAVVHVRPSGNAPELRVYAETADEETAQALCVSALSSLEMQL